MKNKRKHIPIRIKFVLLQEAECKCPFCGNEEVAYFEFHHIDDDRSNAEISNLITLCRICHGKITKGSVCLDEVKKAKTRISNKVSKPFKKVEIEAQFPGGEVAWSNYLKHVIKIPEEAIEQNIAGTVVVFFVVNDFGQVQDVKALTGPPILREEAVRAIKASPLWIPANQNGYSVKAFRKQEITFHIEQNGIGKLISVLTTLFKKPS